MNIKPLHDRIVVKAANPEGKTASGIIIPDSAQEKPMHGEVVAVGPGKYENGTLIPMTLKKGDRILYGKYSGAEVTIDEEEVLMMRESDAYAIVTVADKSSTDLVEENIKAGETKQA